MYRRQRYKFRALFYVYVQLASYLTLCSRRRLFDGVKHSLRLAVNTRPPNDITFCELTLDPTSGHKRLDKTRHNGRSDTTDGR